MITGFRRIALVLAMFCLPLEYLSFFNVGSLPITPTKFAGLLLILAGALQWLAGPRSVPASSKHLWVLAFGFSFAVSNVVTIMSGVPFLSILPFFTTDISLLLLYFLVLVLVRAARDLDWVFAGFILGSVFVGATQFLGYGVVVDSEIQTRLGGLGGNPNGTAQNLAVALPMILVLMFQVRPLWQRLASFGVFLFLVAAGFATLSRSLFMTIPAMYSLALVRFRRMDLIRYTVFGFVLLCLSLLIAPTSVWNRISTLETSRLAADGSAQSRLLQYKLALIAFAKNPVAGVGRRNFMNWAAYEERTPSGDVIHNMYLAVAAEQGLLGLIPYLAIIIITWREYTHAWRLLGRGRARSDPDARRLQAHVLGLQVALLGGLVGGLFHPMLNFKPLWLLFGLSSAIRGLAEIRIADVEKHGTDRYAEEIGIPATTGYEPSYMA